MKIKEILLFTSVLTSRKIVKYLFPTFLFIFIDLMMIEWISVISLNGFIRFDATFS